MGELPKESAAERLERYVRLAAEARDLAIRSRGLEMRESCLEMAAQWLSLAAAAEREIAPVPVAAVSLGRDEQPERPAAVLS